MKIRPLHNWDLNYQQARQIQDELAQKLDFSPFKGGIGYVTGVDCAFSKDKKRVFATAVTMKAGDFSIVEKSAAVCAVRMPYIPGLLSFREAPACLEALEKLKRTPDVLFVDGQGIAHPRRMGIASHIGLFAGIPTVGCAKSRLIGHYEEPGLKKGDRSDLLISSERIGQVVRTRDGVKPLFVSPGNRVSAQQAGELVLAMCGRYRLPEPAREAHRLVTQFKKTGTI